MGRCPDVVRRADFETWDVDGHSTSTGTLGGGWAFTTSQAGYIYKGAGTGADGGNTMRHHRADPSGNQVQRARYIVNARPFRGTGYTARVKVRRISYGGFGSAYGTIRVNDGYGSAYEDGGSGTSWTTITAAINVNAKATQIIIDVESFSDSNSSDHIIEFDDLDTPKGRPVTRTLTKTPARTPVPRVVARSMTPYSPDCPP